MDTLTYIAVLKLIAGIAF